jgi:hypothetical protein
MVPNKWPWDLLRTPQPKAKQEVFDVCMSKDRQTDRRHIIATVLSSRCTLVHMNVRHRFCEVGWAHHILKRRRKTHELPGEKGICRLNSC